MCDLQSRSQQQDGTSKGIEETLFNIRVKSAFNDIDKIGCTAKRNFLFYLWIAFTLKKTTLM